MIQPTRLGHLVLRVRDAQASKQFYMKAFGLKVASESPNGKMVFLSLGDEHHDLALFERGVTGETPTDDQPGLEHFAFRLESFEDLQAAYTEWKLQGYEPDPILHHVTHSIYIDDPDGNRVELYADRREGGFHSWITEGPGKTRAEIDTGPMDMATGKVVAG